MGKLTKEQKDTIEKDFRVRCDRERALDKKIKDREAQIESQAERIKSGAEKNERLKNNLFIAELEIKKLNSVIQQKNQEVEEYADDSAKNAELYRAEKARSELFLKQIQKGQELNDKLVEALKTSAETNVKAAKAIAVFISRSEN